MAEPTAATDAGLLRRYAERQDARALETFFARHADLAYRAALRVTRNASDAEDAVQTAFVKIMRDAARCPNGDGIKAWIARVAINAAKDMIKSSVRRRAREEAAASDDAFRHEQGMPTDGDWALMLRQTLDRLPERYRMPVWLHHGEGLSFADVSRTLAIPTDTVRKQASRGMAMLRTAMARAGAPVSAASLVALFTVPPAEAAAPSLLNSIGPIVESGGSAGLSPAAARLVAHPPSPTVFWLKPAIAIALATTAVGTVAGLRILFRSRQERHEPNLAPPAAESSADPSRGDKALFPPPIAASATYRWDFETPDVPEILRPVTGTWRHVPGGGPGGSGCMETDGEFFQLILDFPLPDLPVRVSYRTDSVWPSPPGDHLIAIGWAEYDRVIEFKGVADYKPPRISPDIKDGQNIGWWPRLNSYVMPDRIVTTTDGRLAIAMACRPRSTDTRLALFARGSFRIDHLEIQSVSPEEVPDISPHIEASRAVPNEQRDGRRVPLPGLKPGRLHHRIEAVFHNYR